MNNIYISSACISSNSLVEVIEQLNAMGFWHIELTGGTAFNENTADILHKYKSTGNSFLLHNYFPIPRTPMVLNAGSLDQTVLNWSRNHILHALDLSATIGAKKFAFHAPFRLAIPTDKIGKQIPRFDLYPFEDVLEAFKTSLQLGQTRADELGIDLYIENNVYSTDNYAIYGEDYPFLFLTHDEYEQLNSNAPFQYLLDVAHLKVSCQTIGADFYTNLSRMIAGTDYIHISDNAGERDSNDGFRRDSELFDMLSEFDLSAKTMTLETYGSLEDLIVSYKTLLHLTG